MGPEHQNQQKQPNKETLGQMCIKIQSWNKNKQKALKKYRLAIGLS